MELLGHSQMRTTMDIYSHVMPALARAAADRMGPICSVMARRMDLHAPRRWTSHELETRYLSGQALSCS
jgi:hypothetical protein